MSGSSGASRITRTMTNRMCLQTLPLLKSGQLHEGCMPMDTVYTLPAVQSLASVGDHCVGTTPTSKAYMTAVPAPVAPKTANSSLGPSDPEAGLVLRSMTNMRCPEPARGAKTSVRMQCACETSLSTH